MPAAPAVPASCAPTSAPARVADGDVLRRLAAVHAKPAPAASANPPPHFSLFERAEGYAWLSRHVFQPLLRDRRDDSFVLCTVLMLLTVVPSAVWLMREFAWWRAALHVVLVLQYAGSFTAILHNSCHRKVFAVDWLNHVVPVLLAPLLGQTWNTYYYHHVKHHHVEDNGPNDLSSTLRFQRDSVVHFAMYFLRFLLFVAIELPIYFVRRRQYWNAAATFFGEAASLCVMLLLARINPLGACFVCLVPLLIVRFGMMSGNWAQHAFIDQDDPTSNYKSSVTCIQHDYNREAFNDGYHTSHHLNPRRHWSEHPAHLLGEHPVYYAARPIVFKQVDFMGLWFLLMCQNYTRLAELYVHLGPEHERMSQQQIIDVLKSRTRAFTPEQIRKHYPERAART